MDVDIKSPFSYQTNINTQKDFCFFHKKVTEPTAVTFQRSARNAALRSLKYGCAIDSSAGNRIRGLQTSKRWKKKSFLKHHPQRYYKIHRVGKKINCMVHLPGEDHVLSSSISEPLG